MSILSVASAGSQDVAGKSVAPGQGQQQQDGFRYRTFAWQQQQQASQAHRSGGTARCVGHSAGPWFTQPA